MDDKDVPEQFQEFIRGMDLDCLDDNNVPLEKKPIRDKIGEIEDEEQKRKLATVYSAFLVADNSFYAAKNHFGYEYLKSQIPKESGIEPEKLKSLIGKYSESIKKSDGLTQLSDEQKELSPEAMAYQFTITRLRMLLAIAVDRELNLPLEKHDPYDIEIVREDPTLRAYLEDTYLPAGRTARVEALAEEVLDKKGFVVNSLDTDGVPEEELPDVSTIREQSFHRVPLGYAGTKLAVEIYLNALDDLEEHK